MLADLLEENAALHAVYPLAGAGAVTAALEHVASLRARANAPAIATACDDLSAALQGSRAALEAGDAEAPSAALRETQSAMERPSTSRRERDALLVRQQLLRHRVNQLAAAGIPRVAHLIRTDSSTQDLPLIQYLCYRSVLAHCKGWRVMLHTPSVPQGARWSRLLPHLDMRVAGTPQWLGDRRLVAAAHQSDVWRVRQLIEHGGIYFDWDLLLVRSPDALLDHACVMALERKEEGYDEVLGVSAIAARPGSAFLQRWLDEMPAVFNPRKYVAHSVALTHRLASELPALVRVLGYRSFYDPGWTSAAMSFLFDPAERLPDDALRERFKDALGMHLFCSHENFLRWADSLTEREIERTPGNLAALLKPYL